MAEVVIPLVGPRWSTIRKVSLTPDPLTSLPPPTHPSPLYLHPHTPHLSTSTHTPLTSLPPPTHTPPLYLHPHTPHLSTSTHTTLTSPPSHTPPSFLSSTHTAQWPSFIRDFLSIRLKLWVKGTGTSLWRSPTECESENALPSHHPAPHWSSDVCTTMHNHVHEFFCQLNLTDCTSAGACPVPVSSL